MKNAFWIFSLVAVICGACHAQETKHASLVSKVLAGYSPPAEKNGNPDAMANFAHKFLESLGGDLKKQALLAYDSKERGIWTNTPPRGPQGGVRLGDCDKGQLKLACNLLRIVMSQQGYEKARNVMLADDLLLRNGKPRPGFGAENFWLAIFGEPSATKPWAIQLDGHHVAINLSFHGEKISLSPSFIGTQPRAIKYAGKKIEVMEGEVGVAYELINSLSDEQKREAIISKKRGGIATAPSTKDGVIPEPTGFACKKFNDEQRGLVKALLMEYVGDLPAKQAGKRLEQLMAEVNQMTFAWSGPTTVESDISYRLQGPTLIIEYACQDLGGDPLDHLHSMYRNPKNEYGVGDLK
ncbi:MAG: hypothetical protein ACI8XO_002779 [Verrucomicrobiales bacterium]|jgi:hypothetical protein